jgi:hypothetical protein
MNRRLILNTLWLAMTAATSIACAGDDDALAERADETRRHDGGDDSARGDGGGGRGDEPHQTPDAAGTIGEVRDASASDSGSDIDTGSAGANGQAGGSGSAGAAAQADAGASGSGAMDGGSAGSQLDAGDPPAEPRTCYDDHPDALFCDDFEASDLPGWSRYRQGPDGQTTHTTALAHAGDGALSSVKFAPGDSDPIYADALGQRISGHLYVRAYLYVPSGFVIAPADSAASLLVLGESAGALGGLSLVLAPSSVALQINGQVQSNVEAQHVLPRDRWLCVRIDFEIAQAGTARLRIGGQVIAQGMRNTLMPTSYQRLWLGINWIRESQTDTVRTFYDDVVIGTQDIPCD